MGLTTHEPLWPDDLDPGRAWIGSSREVSDDDLTSFADLTGDRHPLHTDAEFAARGPFGAPVAHGLLGLGLAHGLMWARTGELDQSALAFLGIRDWQFLAPIRVGDVIRVGYEVDSRRGSSEDSRGVVEFRVQVRNQDDVLVQRGVKSMLIARKVSA